MITLQALNNIDELNPLLESYKDNGWELDKAIQDFEINDQCRQVSNYYCGRSYIAVALATKEYSTIERVIRVVLGVLATLATLGLALCLRSVRSFFTERKQVICLAVFNNDSGPDHVLGGMPKSFVTAFRVDQACAKKPCEYEDCDQDHGSIHACLVTTSDGQEQYAMLSDLQIRDHLEWLDSGIVEADYSHFAHVGEIKA